MVVACEKVSLDVNHSVTTLKGHNLTPTVRVLLALSVMCVYRRYD